MKLTIKSVSATDFGSYKCVSKNSLGDTDGTIKLYRAWRVAAKARELGDDRGSNEVMDLSGPQQVSKQREVALGGGGGGGGRAAAPWPPVVLLLLPVLVVAHGVCPSAAAAGS
ncbi:Protein CEPU-1 [Gryllus bimaculatus]|nr:Protein CEPU-1 [Gryllus bimaculatus]